MVFQGMKVADIFLDLANSTQQRWRLKCHIGKLMMPSGDTKATWDSNHLLEWGRLNHLFDILIFLVINGFDGRSRRFFFWPAKQLGGVVSEMKWV